MKLKHWAYVTVGAVVFSFGAAWGINYLIGYYDVPSNDSLITLPHSGQSSHRERYDPYETIEPTSRPVLEDASLESVVERNE